MKTIYVILLFSLTVFGQNCSKLFNSEIPQVLKEDKQLLGTTIESHLERNSILGATNIYLYLEHLNLRFENNVVDADKNLQNTYRRYVANAINNRNKYLEQAQQKYLASKPDFWNMKGQFSDVIDEWKINQENEDNLEPVNYQFDQNKLFYYSYKLLAGDELTYYDSSVDYSELYGKAAKTLISKVESSLEAKTIEDENFIIETVNNNLWLFSDLNEAYQGMKSRYSEVEIAEILITKQSSEKKDFYVTLGYSVEYPDITYNLFYKILSFSPLVTEDVEFTFGTKSLVALSLGRQINLLENKTYLSYLDINVGGAYSFENLVRNSVGDYSAERILTENIKNYDAGLVHNYLGNISSFFILGNISVGTPVFRTGEDFVWGIEVDLLVAYMNIESELYNFTKKENIVRTDSNTDISVLPGLWIDFKIWQQYYCRLKGVTNGYVTFNLLREF